MLLFSAFHINLWSGSNNDGGCENSIVGQSKILDCCILTSSDNCDIVSDTVKIKQTLSGGLYNLPAVCSALLFLFFVFVKGSRLLFKKSATLVSLCIRMDE